MAQELDDGEFWLPSEFLTDDDLLTDFKTDRFKPKSSDGFSYGFGNHFGFQSDVSSPVESVMGSTETESDEDDFITGLTWKMARSTLRDYDLSSDYASKGWKLSGSPQSTLCGCKPGSSRGSPNYVSSPPDAKDGLGLNLLYAAAGEVARMRMMEEKAAFYSRKLFVPSREPSAVAAAPNIVNPGAGFYPNRNQPHFSYQQLQAARFEQMKQQQMMNVGGWGQGKAGFQVPNSRNGERRHQGLAVGAWPTLQQSQHQQQQPGSGMRAVFLGETGPVKERAGTGVFLPRRYETNPTEIRKKSGSTTVLIPDKVVHALNLKIDSIDAPAVQIAGNPKFSADYGAALKSRNNVGMAQQRRILRPQTVVNQELRLPQEWSY